MELVAKNTEGFIWNQESPTFRIHYTANESYFYQGKVYFGDSIEDEWLIVWLMYKISLEFPGLAISIMDNDGEFLLAEAALDIPEWLTPENSQNRIFIYKNDVHIIPFEKKLQKEFNGLTGLVSIRDALSVLNKNENNTKNLLVSKRINLKIKDFPSKIQNMTHKAYCIIPKSLAIILSIEPQLISTSAQSFYSRDPISLKHCQKMETFPLTDLTKFLVKFNRTQYAKIVSQKFIPPSIFKLPEPTNQEYQYSLLGAKILCGFEMALKNKNLFKKNLPKKTLDALDSLMSSFSDLGYFDSSYNQGQSHYKGIIEPNIQFNDATDKCNTDLQAESLSVVRSSMIIEKILDRINNKNYIFDISSTDLVSEDSDSWMEIAPESLDQLLKTTQDDFCKYGDYDENADSIDESLNSFTKEEKDAAFKLKQVAFNIQSFLKSESSYKGAELVNADYSDDISSDSDGLESAEFLKDIKNSSLLAENKFNKYGEDVIEESDEDIDIDPSSVFQSISKLIGLDITQESHDIPYVSEINNLEPTVEDITKKMDKELYLSLKKNPGKETPQTNFNDAKLTKEKNKYAQTHTDSQEIIDKKNSLNISSSLENLSDISDYSDNVDDDIDIEENMVKNLIESFKSQQGLSGPAGVLFNQFSYKPGEFE
ncbi:hypothetical protein BB561_001498 [Smittium simulii]|uniref:SGT1-domain-containing protein n=1 Tax=Smittium simulii TaxID=133385 RepID=A0A2T9YUB6_9FUNG|nr:hypothetical protein BB561_001498 [Smittium simulii]